MNHELIEEEEILNEIAAALAKLRMRGNEDLGSQSSLSGS